MTIFRPTRTAATRFRDSVQGKRVSEMTLSELAQYVESLQHEISARIDAMIPGGDDDQHYADHIEQANKRLSAERMKEETRIRVRAGFILGGTALVIIFAGLTILKTLGYL